MEVKKNPLLHREYVIIETEREVPPSNQEAIKMISEQTKRPEDVVVIEKIEGKFGKKVFTIRAKVYENVDAKKRIETVPRKVRKKAAKEAAEAAGKK